MPSITSGLLLLVFVSMSPAVVAGRRTIDEHAEGLEVEHDHSETSVWPVTGNDRLVLAQITKILNPSGAEIPWTWENERQSWTFGLVKLTAQKAKGALALHMLHRHGLGPLLASRAGARFMTTFESKLQANGNPTGDEKAKLLVQTQEQYDEIEQLRSLLEQLTLNGLRNLHSWDHAWSVREGTGKVTGCSHNTPGSCVLQAGHSPLAYNFLRQNGFSSATSSSVKSSQFRIMVYIFNPLGYWNLGSSSRNALTTTGNTGDVTVMSWHKEGSSNWIKSLFVGSKKVVVDVSWEGGAQTTLKIPIDEEMNEQLKNGRTRSGQTALLSQIVEKYIEEQLSDHKEYMLANRLTIWAGEEAEFVEMYDSLPSER